MGGLLLPLILLVGGYIFYSRLGGKEMLDNALNEIKGIGGGGGSGSNGMDGLPTVDGINGQVQDLLNKAKSRTGSWTDERGNNFNNQSGQDIQINRQSNTGTGGKITQRQSHSQKSTVFYTIPRFGNL